MPRKPIECINVAASPEEYFQIPPDAPVGLDIDTLNTVLARARAVLVLLTAEGQDTKEGFNISHRILMDAIWCISGYIEQAQQIADYPFNRTNREDL